MGRVTISSLAGQLGLSKASVSYALNGQPGVSDRTRAKVLELAAELGWYPSATARALTNARTGAIGIVLSRDPELIGAEPYYMSLLAGIESVLSAAEMSLLLRMVGSGGARDLAVYERWAGERRVDGVIVLDLLEADPRPGLLAGLRLPFVLHGASGAVRYAATTVDQSADAGTIVDHLRGLGHRRIAHVTGPRTLLHERARLGAVGGHAQRAGMTVADAESDYAIDAAAAATRELLAGGHGMTAVIYGSDLMALGGIQALREGGLDVPADVSVVSWDDSILCRLGVPGVTALQRDPVDHGRRSARLLLDVIGGRAAENVPTGAGELIRRASTGPVRPG
ncbi:MAG: LacI family DNA-binding transcriptional regulator [Actinomycetales bacterium]